MTEDEIGRLAHAAWKAWRIEGGYPDHAWNRAHVRRLMVGHGYPAVEQCTICVPVDAKEHPDFAPRMSLRDSHHEDMAGWDTLADKRKYVVMGMAGYEARQGDEEMRALTSQARAHATGGWARAPQDDPVDHPRHYTSHKSGIEAIEVTEHLDFCLGNAFKYLLRRDLKGGVEDVRKAIWYVRREASLPRPVPAPRSPKQEVVWEKADRISSYETFPFNVAMREIVAYAFGWNESIEAAASALEKWVQSQGGS